MKQISFSYDGPDKTEKKSVKTVPVNICSAEYFKTDYEKMFYDLNKNNHLLCVEDPSIFIQGTRDSRVKKLNHSFLVYEFLKCTDTRLEIDPNYKCETKPAINKWLETKTVHMRVLNEKVDFTKFDEMSIR